MPYLARNFKDCPKILKMKQENRLEIRSTQKPCTNSRNIASDIPSSEYSQNRQKILKKNKKN